MISKKAIFLLFSLLFCLQIFSQTAQENEQITAYNKWLNQSSFGVLFEAKEIQDQGDTLLLLLKSKEGYSDPKKMVLTWPYLLKIYDNAGVSLPQQLLAKLSQVSGKPKVVLSINLICKQEDIFRINITQNGENHVLTEDINQERVIGITPYKAVKDVIFTNFNASIVINKSSNEVKKSLTPILKNFFKPKGPKDFDLVLHPDSSQTFLVSGQKAVITPRYFERVRLDVSFISINEGITELYYELSASFSSGIFQPGKYEDMKREFIPELVEYHTVLQRFIKSRMR